MKKNIFFLIIWCLSFAPPAAAQDNGQEFGNDTLRMINANRSLLAQAQAGFEKISAEYDKKPADALKRELEKTRYKIKALTEESDKLLQKLPEVTKAEELVKYVLVTENARKKEAVEPASGGRDAADRTSDSETKEYARLHEKGLELAVLGEHEKAIRTYQDILLIKPDDDQALMIMGHLHMMLGQFEQAERAFFDAIQIDPGNLREIMPFYENQILKNPNDDSAYTSLGYICLMFKDLSNAEGAFRDALSINPGNPLARSGLDCIAGFNQPNS